MNQLIDITPQTTPEQKAIQESGQSVGADPRFIECLMKLAQYKTANSSLDVTEDNIGYAVDIFSGVKGVIKDADKMKKEVLAFPKAYVSSVNGMFKPIKDGLDSIRRSLGEKIDRQKQIQETAERALYEAALEEQKKNELEGQIPVLGEGTYEESGSMEPIKAPSNILESDSGNKVHTRTELKVEVTDKLKLLKSIISTAKGNGDLGIDLIDIRQADLKRVVKERGGMKGRKIPGVTVTEKTLTI